MIVQNPEILKFNTAMQVYCNASVIDKENKTIDVLKWYKVKLKTFKNLRR